MLVLLLAAAGIVWYAVSKMQDGAVGTVERPENLEVLDGNRDTSLEPAEAQPDPAAEEPGEAAAAMLLKEQLLQVMQTLTPRENKVLRMRFGFEDGKAHTLEEVGKEFQVTRERVRQIEAKALRKLRHPSRFKYLKDCF